MNGPWLNTAIHTIEHDQGSQDMLSRDRLLRISGEETRRLHQKEG
jgi:hypothetical protein